MPTFQNMMIGSSSPGIVAIPGKKFASSRDMFRGQFRSSKPFRSASFSTNIVSVSGVTKDSAGVALGNCVVDLMRTGGDVFVATTTSNASGNFIIYPTVTGPFYIVAYKPGSPDVAGTTVNTIVPI